jgi:hypothetical protein
MQTQIALSSFQSPKRRGCIGSGSVVVAKILADFNRDVEVPVDVKPVEFTGSPRRDTLLRKPDLRCRGVSITRFEGNRWWLRRTRWAMEKVT